MKVFDKYISDKTETFPFMDELQGKKILITGGTGLIGSSIIKFLNCLKENGLDLGVFATSRDYEKAQAVSPDVNWLYQDMTEPIPDDVEVDYVIHTACPTQSKYLSTHPVEVIQQSISGAKVLFDYSMRKKATLVYLSSVEIYGQCDCDEPLSEIDYHYVNHLNPRSCYPESKRLIESLLAGYAFEYGADFKIARLTQTIGPGVLKSDSRVFVQFAKSVLEGKDIVLHTLGESSKSYISTADAILAIFYILFKGQRGEAYNIANESTYISIKDLASFVIHHFNNSISLSYELDSSRGYAPDTKTQLSCEKLRGLGWKANDTLKDMFAVLIQYLDE